MTYTNRDCTTSKWPFPFGGNSSNRIHQTGTQVVVGRKRRQQKPRKDRAVLVRPLPPRCRRHLRVHHRRHLLRTTPASTRTRTAAQVVEEPPPPPQKQVERLQRTVHGGRGSSTTSRLAGNCTDAPVPVTEDRGPIELPAPATPATMLRDRLAVWRAKKKDKETRPQPAQHWTTGCPVAADAALTATTIITTIMT